VKSPKKTSKKNISEKQMIHEHNKKFPNKTGTGPYRGSIIGLLKKKEHGDPTQGEGAIPIRKKNMEFLGEYQGVHRMGEKGGGDL